MPLTASSFVLALAVVGIAATAAQAANCTDAEASDVGTYVTQYDAEIGTSCASDSCSSDCIANVMALAGLLPDCKNLDGTNYRQSILDNVTECAHGANDSITSGGGTTLVASLKKGSRPSTTTGTTHGGTSTGGHSTGAGNGSPLVGMASLSTVAVANAVAVIQLLL